MVSRYATIKNLISPDPPVIPRDHSNVVPFLLVAWNVMVTAGKNEGVIWIVEGQDDYAG